MNRRQRSGQTPSEGEATLALMLRVEGIKFDREFVAVPGRKFRWDFHIEPDLLVEVQGGTWNYDKKTRQFRPSGHNTGPGLDRDYEKTAVAVAHGYRVIQTSTKQVKSGQAIEWIKAAMGVPDA